MENWDRLLAGESLPIRFVVLSRGRSYPFELRLAGSTPHQTTIALVPGTPLLARHVPQAHLVFDARGTIVTYSGLVPSLQEVKGRLVALDATVTYAHEARPVR